MIAAEAAPADGPVGPSSEEEAAFLAQEREMGNVTPTLTHIEKAPGEFKNHGFNAYVSKTGDLSSLIETVRAVLGNRPRATSSYAPLA